MLLAVFISAASSSKTTTNSSSSIIFLLVIAVLFFVMYRFFMKPKQRAAQQQRDVLTTLEPGDEVLTGAGIFGTVQHIQGDRVTLWTGTGSTITVLRRTIARKLDEEEYEEAAADDGSSDHDHAALGESHDDLDDLEERQNSESHSDSHAESTNGSGDVTATGGAMKETEGSPAADFTWPSGTSGSDVKKSEDDDR